MRGAILALDVGEARIGVARAERGSMLAFGRGAVERTHLRADIAAIREQAAREGAPLIVVGLPVRTDGRDSAQAKRVRNFADGLQKAGLQTELEDERFTTQLANRKLIEGGAPRHERRRKGRIDEVSATLILETYLRRIGS
ncbi:MAG: Holliday junction resolvase RuvX [Truepera sp.]|nr:Holliday junction resolvase RuvX [Truepera sp.]